MVDVLGGSPGSISSGACGGLSGRVAYFGEARQRLVAATAQADWTGYAKVYRAQEH